MLLGLRISNVAVIEEVEVAFGAGLTVLTGETGAGKSILVDSLGLLLGGRADADAIRAGCEEASVEGCSSARPSWRPDSRSWGCRTWATRCSCAGWWAAVAGPRPTSMAPW
ncbi:AAA family ATPase [Cystobacter fuscus]